jgi:hypothetical protein
MPIPAAFRALLIRQTENRIPMIRRIAKLHPDSLETIAVPVWVKVVGQARPSSGKRLAAIALLSLVLSSVANHALAHWLGLSRSAPWHRANAVYRRVGPQRGPQVFCAGSSLLVSGLSWPEVSESLGQGIENWTVAGSSPEVWEVFQQQKRVSNTTIIGVSVYDLNEMRLTPERASFVPFSMTAPDLSSSRTDPGLRHRILSQYALLYVRVLYPTAGDADKVLVGLRAKAADLLGQEANLQQHEGVVVERKGVLDVEDAMTSLSDWSSARVLRRVEALRAENHSAHEFFNGPKSRAFRRVLLRAQEQGRVIVAVLPVSQYYADAFLDKTSIAAFEKSLGDEMAAAPQTTLVRLDRVPGISDSKYFLDLAHLNSSGRRLVTPVFLKEVSQGESKGKP